VSPVLAAVTNFWSGEAYDWMVLSVEGEKTSSCVVGGLEVGVVSGPVQLAALRVGLTMEGGGLPNVTAEELIKFSNKESIKTHSFNKSSIN